MEGTAIMHMGQSRETLDPVIAVIKKTTKFNPKLISTLGKLKTGPSLLKHLIVAVVNGTSEQRQTIGEDMLANFLGTPISISVAGIIIYDDQVMNLEDLERQIVKFMLQLELKPPFDFRNVAKFYFPATTIFVHGIVRDHGHGEVVAKNLRQIMRKYGAKRRVQVYDIMFQATGQVKSYLISLEVDVG